MCQEIQPLGRGTITRVDNNSTFWGITFIDVAVPRYYSYGSSEDDDSWKIAELDAIADAFKTRIIAARDRLYELHEKASRYEQTDNDLAATAEVLYFKYTDEADRTLDSWGWFFGGVGSFLEGIFTGLLDIFTGVLNLVGLVFGGLAYLATNLFGICPDELKMYVEEGWGGIASFFSDIPGSFEALFIQFTDDFDEDPAYAIGKLVPDIASIIFGAKGIDKFAKLSKTTKVADNMGDASRVSGVARINEMSPRQITSLSKGQLKESLPDGWTFTENNGFVHIKDEAGVMRLRLDPPTSSVPYSHYHLYDENRNPLTVDGEITSRTSPDAHIPYNGE